MRLTKRQLVYRGYLRSHHWYNLRRAKLKAAGGICKRCEATKRLQVHHLEYRNLYDVLLCDLEVLCVWCHRVEHGIGQMTPQQYRAQQVKRSRGALRRVKAATKKRKRAFAQELRRRRTKGIRKQKYYPGMSIPTAWATPATTSTGSSLRPGKAATSRTRCAS